MKTTSKPLFNEEKLDFGEKENMNTAQEDDSNIFKLLKNL